MRYGIVGTGMMGLEHIRNLLAIDGAEVVAAADPHQRSLDDAVVTAGDHGELATFADHRELLASELCEAVVVASPNMTHAAVLDDVLGADVHVLVEKPLCTTVADCRRVVDAAAERSHITWVGLEYRYIPAVAQLVDRVHGGDVGRVHMAAIREHRYPFLAKVGDWNRFDRNTGGTLVEKCCHFFDLLNLLAGERPTRVFASGAQDVNHLDELYDGEVPDIIDNALVVVEYGSGVRASLDLCMFAEGGRWQEEIAVVGDVGKVEALVPSSGEGHGTIRFGRRDGGWMGVDEREVHDDRVRHQGFHHGSSYLEHLDFLDACRGDKPPAVSVDDGLWSVAVGVAAHRSIDEGRAVELAEVLDT